MIKVVNYQFKLPEHCASVNTTSRSDNWSQGLSPFHLGPCKLYDDYVSKNVENAWQYSKLYEYYADDDGNPNEQYFKWAQDGWNNIRAVRYPMGKGVKPLCSYWAGKKLTYIEARKAIYIPLYTNAVKNTSAYRQLKKVYDECLTKQELLYLIDFDAHNMDPEFYKDNYDDLWTNPNLKVGHAYVLAQMLREDLK